MIFLLLSFLYKQVLFIILIGKIQIINYYYYIIYVVYIVWSSKTWIWVERWLPYFRFFEAFMLEFDLGKMAFETNQYAENI